MRGSGPGKWTLEINWQRSDRVRRNNTRRQLSSDVSIHECRPRLYLTLGFSDIRELRLLRDYRVVIAASCAASAIVAAWTATAIKIPVNVSPTRAITIAKILAHFLVGRMSPYPTVVAVMNDQ